MSVSRATLCLSLILSFGCGEPKFGEELKEPKGEVRSLSLMWQAIPLDEPNRYRVLIALPDADQRSLIVMRSETNQAVTRTIGELPKDRDGNFVDDDVNGGVEYFYRFFEKSTGNPVFESQVRVPRDQVISGIDRMTESSTLKVGDPRNGPQLVRVDRFSSDGPIVECLLGNAGGSG